MRSKLLNARSDESEVCSAYHCTTLSRIQCTLMHNLTYAFVFFYGKNKDDYFSHLCSFDHSTIFLIFFFKRTI
ncbi:hypothetical protein RHMOL_Rhmol03G0086000 [Rhododendron molle]|nr:hypothetical protein RHMOL_Rhmol03G0086000 [Rhododendron molle]